MRGIIYMKNTPKRRYQAAVVLTLAILMIGSTISLSSATQPHTTMFSSTTTTTISSPQNRGEEEIKYYDPDSLVNVIGVEDIEPPFKWQSAIRLTQDELAAYEGWTLTKVNAGYSADNGQLECDATVIIYGEGNATHPGAIIQNDTTYHFTSSGVSTISLLTPLLLDGIEELWISIEWVQTEINAYVAVMDEGPAVDGKGDWGFDGAWSELQIYGLDYNWAIGAIVEGEGKATLSIGTIQGPIGIESEVTNIGEVPARTIDWTIQVTGGILKKVDKTATGTITELEVGASETISLGMFFGLGKIQITITAVAENADEVSVTKSAILIGPIILGIQ
jgi:hypothetical protein